MTAKEAELRQRRAERVAELTKLHESVGAGKPYSGEQKAQFDKLDVLIAELDTEVRAQHAKDEADRTANTERAYELSGDAERDDVLRWRDRNTGRVLRAVRRGESFRLAMAGDSGMRDEDDYRGLTFGGFLGSMVHGPRTDAERRALAEGTDSTGGYLTPTVLLPRVIDALRSRARCFQAGAVTVPLKSDETKIVRVATDPSASFHSENAEVSDSDIAFSAVSFVPRTLIAMVRASRELIEDAVNLDRALETAFAGALATKLDLAVLAGSGTAPEPRGIKNTSGVGDYSMGANGAALADYTPLIRAIELIRTGNVVEPITAAIMAPRTESELGVLEDTTGQPLAKPPMIADLAFLPTTNVAVDETQGTSSNASRVYLGHWPHCLIGIRTSLRIEILRERFADYHQYAFTAFLRADVALEHPESFAMVTGIIPPA